MLKSKKKSSFEMNLGWWSADDQLITGYEHKKDLNAILGFEKHYVFKWDTFQDFDRIEKAHLQNWAIL